MRVWPKALHPKGAKAGPLAEHEQHEAREQHQRGRRTGVTWLFLDGAGRCCWLLIRILVCVRVCVYCTCASVCVLTFVCVCVFIGLCSHVYSSLDVCVGVCVTASGSGAHFSLTLHSAIQLHLSLSVIWVFPHTDGKRSRSTHVSTTAGAGGTLTCIFLLGCPVCSIFVCNQVCMYLCTYVCTGMYVCMYDYVCMHLYMNFCFHLCSVMRCDALQCNLM